ncbi:NADPH:quinone reductase [Pedobacter terrae]|uniref:NADPH:quinone reductase n=1 Tax=Pedobacter terrae TaxID=405671 RepID=A0A1G8A8Y2_9SPHI|nr:alcohol dehydrogenase catalytic domain-containing protein [Pedobacter terrae]SDH17333.1 NADPH:quinone reductase [Pedobacter terrae]
MKAIRVREFGSSEVLTYITESRPIVGDQEVLIKIEAAGVGRVDVSARQGYYAPLPEPGFIPGIEAAGEVIVLGKNVDKNWLGKKVFVRLFSGGYAEEIAVRTEALVEIPAPITSIKAVAFGVNALVASFAMDLANLDKGDRLLLRGATGGIGTVAALIAKTKGIHVTAAMRSIHKKIHLENIGIDDFLMTDNLANLSLNYHSILDLVLGSDMDAYVNLLAKRGNYIIAGGLAGSPEIDFGMSFLKRVHQSLSLHVFSLNAFSDEEIRTRMGQIFILMIDHSLSAPIQDVFPLKDAGKAHDLMVSGNFFGKIILAN